MSARAEILADQPAGYWDLDELTGTSCLDSSGNGHALTYANAPTLGVSPLTKEGTAVTFNGTNQSATVTSTVAGINANGVVTVKCKVKTSASAAGNPMLVCSDDTSVPSRYFQFRLSTTGKLDVIFFDTGGGAHEFIGAITINDGASHECVGVYDGAAVHAYVDGFEDGTGLAAVFTLATVNPGIQFAERHSSGSDTNFLTGTLDDVAIYTSALTPARILAHYNAGIDPGRGRPLPIMAGP